MENKKKKMNLTVDRNRTKYCDKSVKCRYRHNELKYNVKLEMEMRHYLSKWQVEGKKEYLVPCQMYLSVLGGTYIRLNQDRVKYIKQFTQLPKKNCRNTVSISFNCIIRYLDICILWSYGKTVNVVNYI